MKRDLKADLELCMRLKELCESQRSRAQARKLDVIKLPETIDIATHANERAIKAETLVLELREALNKIAYPVRYLQNEADEKNFSLDGRVATELANSSHWLKSIAKEVLGDET